eukprot:3713317-Pyramimonas_sp.AAC.1
MVDNPEKAGAGGNASACCRAARLLGPMVWSPGRGLRPSGCIPSNGVWDLRSRNSVSRNASKRAWPLSPRAQ